MADANAPPNDAMRLFLALWPSPALSDRLAAHDAHLTLARHAQGAVRPAAPPPVRWRADRGYWLVRSLPGGSYRRVQPLAGASP